MITRDESDALRERLLAILHEDAHNADRLLERLRAVGRETGIDAHSALLLILTRLAFEEEEARRHWSAILSNREELSAALGREVGARVAILDYFMNINRRLVKPVLIDLDLLESGDEDGTVDALTGLLTARTFRSQLQAEIRRSRRYHLPASIVLIDLDDFGRVNAEVGRHVGDRILREAADVLGASSRDIDRAARPGEDEFALLLPETPRDGALRVAERIRSRVESTFAERNGSPLGLTLSAGIACFPDDAPTPEGLLERAAQALYQAKALGRNRVQSFEPERRQFLRHDLLPGMFEVEVLAPVDRGPLDARNLSRSGLLFASPEPIEVGEEIEIRLVRSGDDTPGGGEALRVRGWVVRLEELPDPAPPEDGAPGQADDGTGDRYEIGVAFDRARSESAQRLMEFLARGRSREGSGS